MTAQWSKDSPSWGSALRVQRNNYAALVSAAMVGQEGMCPSCLGELDLVTKGASEVDKVNPLLDYCQFNICYLCRACNQGRSELQSDNRDWTHLEQYAKDVREASAKVIVPSVRSARAWWQGLQRVNASVSRYA